MTKFVTQSFGPAVICWSLTIAWLVTPASARAETYGAIEIGGKGIKATAVEVTGEGEDIDVKVLLADTTNTALAAGVAKEGRFDAAALAETVKAVKMYHDRFRKEFEISPERIHIVGSSGLFAAITDKPDLIKENQTGLSNRVKGEVGLGVAFIDVKREAELSIIGTLPRNRRKTGVLIDIGGGNTKGGYLIQSEKSATFGIPFGTVTFAELAKKNNANDPKLLAKLCEEKVVPLLRKELSTLADLGTRNRVYLSGGVVWTVATLAHPTNARSFTALTLKEVEQIEAKLAADPKSYPEPDLSGVKDEKLRERAMAELARVKKVYPPDQLLAGIQILKSVFREIGEEKQFFFARHGYVAWLLAYVTEAAGTTPIKKSGSE